MSDELNVWRELFQEFQALRRASCLDEAEQEAAAVIRTYGDKRYQQAIADVVEWLGRGSTPISMGHSHGVVKCIPIGLAQPKKSPAALERTHDG